jgi:hypothetical protein
MPGQPIPCTFHKTSMFMPEKPAINDALCYLACWLLRRAIDGRRTHQWRSCGTTSIARVLEGYHMCMLISGWDRVHNRVHMRHSPHTPKVNCHFLAHVLLFLTFKFARTFLATRQRKPHVIEECDCKIRTRTGCVGEAWCGG